MAGLIIGVLAWALLAGGPLLAYLRVVPPLAGLGLFTAGGLAGFASAALGLVQLFRQGGSASVIAALALGGLAALALAAASWPAVKAPPINDIATSPGEPLAFVHAPGLPGNEGRSLSYPAAFAGIQRRAYPAVAPLALDAAPGAVYDRALALARERWEITWRDREARRFEAVTETSLFRFRDDIAVRVSPGEQGGAVVDMRSKSRAGKSDLGANAGRIQQFLSDLEASFEPSGS